MVKKKIIISLEILLGVGAILLLIIFNLDYFVSTTKRLSEVLEIDSLKSWFEVYNDNNNLIYQEAVDEINQHVDQTIEHITNSIDKPFSEVLMDALFSGLDFLFNFIIYFCNYGVNALMIAYIFFHETFEGEQENIKISPLATGFYSVGKLIERLRNYVIKAFKWLLKQLDKYKRVIFFGLVLFTTANGFLYNVLVEFLIFVIVYVWRMVNFETYLLIFQVVQTIFIFLFPKLKYVPLWVLITLLIILVFFKAVSKAKYRLLKNHKRLKKFAKDDLTQTTFINGPPGTGKTLLNVSLSLATEENFIEELEKKLLDYELQFKYLNFAKIRANPDAYPEHKEYIDTYKMLYERGSFIISNYAIYSPLFNEYSKIFNFDYMRVNKPATFYPLEEYLVVSISEFDKEYNSHDNKKEVGEDGAATFFSTVSHDLKRHAKIFVDYQLKDQVPLRIRGNAEYFLSIKENKKKYPLLLYIYYLPIIGLYKMTRSLIKQYETRRKNITKISLRKGPALYKRNDITLIYAILRCQAYTLKRVCDWFDTFYYFRLSTRLLQEGEDSKGIKQNLCINIRDLSYEKQKLYDSTFLSFSYEQKKNKAFKELDRFTKLAPSKEELDKCNSRFYNKINK